MERTVELLRSLEKRMCAAGIQDNLRTIALHIRIHSDGSGSVVREYTPAFPNDKRPKIVRAMGVLVNWDEDDLFMFRNPAELINELETRLGIKSGIAAE